MRTASISMCPSVRMAILRLGNRQIVRGVNEELAEIARIVAVGQRNGRCRAELTEERPQPGHDTNQIVRPDGEHRILDRVAWQRRLTLGIAGDRFGLSTGDRHAHAALGVKHDRVTVVDAKRCRVGAVLAQRTAVSPTPSILVSGFSVRHFGNSRRHKGIAIVAIVLRHVGPGSGCQRCYRYREYE